jgi:hypothetical protein
MTRANMLIFYLAWNRQKSQWHALEDRWLFLCQWAELFQWQDDIWAVTVQGDGTDCDQLVTQTALSSVTATNSLFTPAVRYNPD